MYLFAFEVNMHVRLARNMRQQNFEPALKISQIGYNSRLIELLGDIANGWTNHIDYLPMLNEDEPARSPGAGRLPALARAGGARGVDRPVPRERLGSGGAVRRGPAHGRRPT